MAEPTPPVSVVVPARDCAQTLAGTVRSALSQDYLGPLEVVVAVGPSADRTAEVAAGLAESDPRVRLVENPDGTTPAALNRAITAVRGDVVVRLDAHSRPSRSHVRRAVALLEETCAGNVGGPQVPVAEGGFGACVAAAMTSRAGSGGAVYRVGGEPGPVDTVYLGAFPRAALEAVGGFDETLVRNQDYELNIRLRDAGYAVHFHPDLAVEYAPRGSVRELWRQYWSYGAWKRRVALTHPRSLRPRQLAAPALVLALAASLGAAAGLRSAWPLVLPGGYVAALGAAGAAAAPRPALGPGTALALGVMHLAWGLGFLVGRR